MITLDEEVVEELRRRPDINVSGTVNYMLRVFLRLDGEKDEREKDR